jgi:hypothetical protein
MSSSACQRLRVPALAALVLTVVGVAATTPPITAAGGDRVHAAKGKKRPPPHRPFGKPFDHEYAITAVSLKITFEVDYNIVGHALGTQNEQWQGTRTAELSTAAGGIAAFRNYLRKGETPDTQIGSLSIPARTRDYPLKAVYFKRGDTLEDQWFVFAEDPVRVNCDRHDGATSGLTARFFLQRPPEELKELFHTGPQVRAVFDTFVPDIECRDARGGFTVRYPRAAIEITTRFYGPTFFTAAKVIEVPLDREYDYKAPEGGNAHVTWRGSVTLERTKANPIK